MLETILSSAVVAAIIAAFVAWWTAQKKISIENITRERRDWRDKVRLKALEVHDALIQRDKEKLDRLRNEFRMILNPNSDPDKKTPTPDQEIVACIDLPEEGGELARSEEFATRIALLLKHDWERVKLEAGPALLRLKRVGPKLERIIREPERKDYSRGE